MPNIIEWADWQAAQANLNAANKAVSGMTPAEAQAALNFGQTGLQNGSNLHVVNSQNVPSGGENIIQFPDASASQASGDYIASGGQVGPGGAALSSPKISQTNNMAMTQKAGGLASVGALLSVNLPTVAAAIAPIAGVALGAGLYSLNPELWEKISRALLPFCYNDTQLIPIIADENGNTYVSKEAVDAVKEVLGGAQGVGTITTTSGDAASDLIDNGANPFPFSFQIGSFNPIIKTDFTTQTTYRISEYRIDGAEVNVMASEADNSADTVYFFSKKPFTASVVETYYNKKDNSVNRVVNHVYEVNLSEEYGKPVYYVGVVRLIQFAGVLDEWVTPYYPNLTVNSLSYGVDIFPIGYLALYGSEASLPEGISKWTGIQYPLNPEGIGVVTRISSDGIVQTNPYYPITMPVGDPGVSPTPNEVPEPGKNTEIAPAVDPWLTPKPDKETYPEGQPESEPANIPDPIPGNNPNLDPNANPSQEPEPQPEPDPDALQSNETVDGGTASPPIIPVIPVLPSSVTGLLHVYNPTQEQLDAFGNWLWTTFSGDLIDTVSKLFNDPMDAVIGLHELYTTPAVSGSSSIRAGFLDSGVSSNLVGSRYTSINCGSIVVQEYYQNYLDYSPYTKCYIYLPFVGIVPVLADDIVGNAVNVTYHVDSYTGCCIAVVTVAREGYSSTVYQFEGNCAVEIPITSGYQSTLMGALIGVGATALTGNPHAGIAAANLGRASLGKNDVSHSGSFGSSYGAMGAKIPYIIVKRPTQKSVVNYNQDYGFPAHKRVSIGACTGYLRAREVHVISPTATDEEKAKIEDLLKSGVFVK